jgi:hypothetical protein
VAIQLQPNKRMKITGASSSHRSNSYHVTFRSSCSRALLERAALTAASRNWVNGESNFMADQPLGCQCRGGGY